jgi:hypothetical protein
VFSTESTMFLMLWYVKWKCVAGLTMSLVLCEFHGESVLA